MDIRLPYVVGKKLGVKGLLKVLQGIYPDYELYSISMDWFDSREYIAKAKGVYGDVIVGWN